MSVLEALEQVVMKTPDDLAFVWRDSMITYKELWEKSNCVANYLLEQDKQLDAPVIVYGHMQPEMIIAFLGCVKAKRAYIPIDVSVPHERVLKIVENSKANIFLSPMKVTDIFTFDGLQVVEDENFQNIFTSYHSSDTKDTWVHGEDNFYIIFTSGSTGNPKGVQITHDNVQSFVDWMLNDFDLKEGQTFLNQAPFSFDLSVMDLYPSLLSGGTIFAIDKEMIARPKQLFEAFKTSTIHVWTSTPSFAEMCLMDPSFNAEMLPDLHTFLFCGEVLPVEIAKKLKERFPQATIYNTYGPTEATVAVTSIEVTDDVLSTYTTLPVGACKKDCNLVIMSDGKIVPDGEKGEIVIVGPSVSKGYLGQKELTEKAFFEINGQRAYKTGDAGYLKEGLLFYGGRLDFQIKLHGYRMELEEIEHQLRKSKYVKATIVVPMMKNGKADSLTAVVVPEQHSFEKEYQLTSAIKKEIATMLPSYMIPRKFLYKESLPMTNNGKLDRKKVASEVTL